MRSFVLVALLPLWAAGLGCGVPDDAALADLSNEDIEELCVGQSTEEQTCSNDGGEYTIDATTEVDCADGLSRVALDCDGTVADWRACTEAAPDLCDAEAVTEWAESPPCVAAFCTL